MKSFYDGTITAIRNNNTVSVCWSNYISTTIVTKPLLAPFTVNVVEPLIIFTVDDIDILSYITIKDNIVSIDRPFYSWLHQILGNGWILYDNSTL